MEIDRQEDLQRTRAAIGADEEYAHGFHDDYQAVYSTGQGLNEEIIRKISAKKQEPDWMLDFRLQSYQAYLKMPMQDWGPDLSELNFDEIYYYNKPTNGKYRDWDDVPQELKDTFERLGVPEAERKWLAGSSAQYESEVVYHRMKEEFEKTGIVFTDTDTAVQEYPELVREYLGSLVKPTNNKLAALNSAVWSGEPLSMYPRAFMSRHRSSLISGSTRKRKGSLSAR